MDALNLYSIMMYHYCIKTILNEDSVSAYITSLSINDVFIDIDIKGIYFANGITIG